ncbi:MAG: hypothetical protein WCS31_02765 [Verrucomicrobiae bacterium]
MRICQTSARPPEERVLDGFHFLPFGKILHRATRSAPDQAVHQHRKLRGIKPSGRMSGEMLGSKCRHMSVVELVQNLWNPADMQRGTFKKHDLFKYQFPGTGGKSGFHHNLRHTLSAQKGENKSPPASPGIPAKYAESGDPTLSRTGNKKISKRTARRNGRPNARKPPPQTARNRTPDCYAKNPGSKTLRRVGLQRLQCGFLIAVEVKERNALPPQIHKLAPLPDGLLYKQTDPGNFHRAWPPEEAPLNTREIAHPRIVSKTRK